MAKEVQQRRERKRCNYLLLCVVVFVVRGRKRGVAAVAAVAPSVAFPPPKDAKWRL